MSNPTYPPSGAASSSVADDRMTLVMSMSGPQGVPGSQSPEAMIATVESMTVEQKAALVAALGL